MATGLSDRLLDLLQLWFLSRAIFVEMEEELEEEETGQYKSICGRDSRVTWRLREALRRTNNHHRMPQRSIMCYYRMTSTDYNG